MAGAQLTKPREETRAGYCPHCGSTKLITTVAGPWATGRCRSCEQVWDRTTELGPERLRAWLASHDGQPQCTIVEEAGHESGVAGPYREAADPRVLLTIHRVRPPHTAESSSVMTRVGWGCCVVLCLAFSSGLGRIIILGALAAAFLHDRHEAARAWEGLKSTLRLSQDRVLVTHSPGSLDEDVSLDAREIATFDVLTTCVGGEQEPRYHHTVLARLRDHDERELVIGLESRSEASRIAAQLSRSLGLRERGMHLSPSA